MSKSRLTLAATAVVAAGIVAFAGAASAMPLAGGLALKQAAPVNVESVQWRGRGGGWGGGWRGGGWRGRGWGGAGAGFVAGALLGGALVGPGYYGYYGYYGPGPYYGPEPYYADPGPYADPAGGGDPVAYCMQRFKSYDPRSGTYLGYDGLRHPCP
jgi:BA14K-like protein